MKKTKVLQIDINKGTQWGDKNTNKFIREFCIPSVQNFCSKYNYDYDLITESVYEKKYGQFDFLATKEKHYSFERYFHFKGDFDNIVYVDNDVYVHRDCEPLPKINGLMNAKEPEGKSSNIFREVNSLPIEFSYYNSGVTMCDNVTATFLSNYMINRLDNYERAKGKNTDNMMLNEFIIKNKLIFRELDSKWNYMPFLPNSIKIENFNFFHFVGITGKKLVNFFQSQKNSIDDFLDNIHFK